MDHLQKENCNSEQVVRSGYECLEILYAKRKLVTPKLIYDQKPIFSVL